MPESARRIVHFLVHVPKCAGTTVEWHFQRHLGNRFYWAPRWRSPLRDVVGNRYPGISPADLADIAAVSGHSLSANLAGLFPGAEIRESVLLRDPVGWHLSMYNYRLERGGIDAAALPFARWYATVRRNPISRFLLNRYFGQGVPALYRLSSAARLRFLEMRLARFHFVGGLHMTNDLIANVSEQVGITPAAERENTNHKVQLRTADLDAAQLEQIRSDNRLDQVLFDRWADRGWTNSDLAPAPALSRFDQADYLIGDIRSGIRREIGG